MATFFSRQQLVPKRGKDANRAESRRRLTIPLIMELQRRSCNIVRANVRSAIVYFNDLLEETEPPVKKLRTHHDYILQYALALWDLDAQGFYAKSEEQSEY